jgi:GT2 family glycosyltransferase
MKLLSVMVAYNEDISQSKTFLSIKGAFAQHDRADSLRFLVYDNSPAPQSFDWSLPIPMSYVHDPTNAGLAKAYNFALEAATSEGCDWLLLLDQDSTLPENFTVNLSKTADAINDDESLVAIVPRVRCLEEIVSPSIVNFGGFFRPVDASMRGVCHRQVTSINSGTMLRISFIQKVGGFNTSFPLDYLDHWLFSRIYSNNKRVLLSESNIDHELSVVDYDKWMNLGRYDSILAAEMLFLKTCRPKYDKYFYMLQLLKRIVFQSFQYKKFKYHKSTFRTFKSLLVGAQDQGPLH